MSHDTFSFPTCEAILKQLGLDRRTWCELVAQFGKLFIHVAGRPRTIDATRSRVGHHRYHPRAKARSLLGEEAGKWIRKARTHDLSHDKPSLQALKTSSVRAPAFSTADSARGNTKPSS